MNPRLAKIISPFIILLFDLSSCSTNNDLPSTSSKYTSLNAMVFVRSDIGKLEALNPDDGSTVWSYMLEPNPNINYNNIYSSPAYADSTIYIGSSDYYVYAINAKNGLLKWKCFTGPTMFPPHGRYISSPCVYNNVVYIGGDKLYAINALTGVIIWSKDLEPGVYGEVHSSPTVANNILYINSLYTFYSFNAATGAPIANLSSINVNYRFSHSSPCYYNGTVYNITDRQHTTFTSSMIYGANPLSLLLITTDFADLSLKPTTYSSPVIVNNSLYICADSVLYGYTLGPGGTIPRRWSFKSNGSYDFTSPDADGNLVFSGNNAGVIYAINAASGTIAWTLDVKSKGDDRIINSPVVANNEVYISSNKAIYALNATDGSVIWRKPTTGNLNLSSSACVISKQGQVFHAAVSGMRN